MNLILNLLFCNGTPTYILTLTMNNSIKVLHLEDNLLDSYMIKKFILQHFGNADYHHVDTGDGFKGYFTEQLPDIILSDINVPVFSGFDAMRWCNENYPLIPFIVITGSIDEETAAKTIQLGAWDYVVKERMHRLPSALQNVLLLRNEKAEALKARKLAENILETTPSGVFTVDTKGNITSWNKMAEKMTGYSAKTVVGQPCKILGSDRCISSCYLFNSEIPKPMLNQECDLIDANGHKMFIVKNADLLRNEHGEIIGGIESFLDQSEKIKMTRDLIQAKNKAEESDRLKTSFLENISHEIRTPLNAIIGFSDLIIDPDISNTEKAEFISTIQKGTDQLLEILDKVLQFSLIESGEIVVSPESFGISDLLTDLYTYFDSHFNHPGIQFSIESGTSCQLVSDRAKTRTIVGNLIENAFKFCDEGEIKCGFKNYGTHCLVYVSDTGVGIEDQYAERIFNRFERIKDKAHVIRGTGLGLAIAKAFTEALQGEIWFEKNHPKGTIFFVRLPNLQQAEQSDHV